MGNLGPGMDNLPLGQQVYQQAAGLDSEIEALNGRLGEIRGGMDELQMKNRGDIRASLKFGGEEDDELRQSAEAADDIEQILGKYYE